MTVEEQLEYYDRNAKANKKLIKKHKAIEGKFGRYYFNGIFEGICRNHIKTSEWNGKTMTGIMVIDGDGGNCYIKDGTGQAGMYHFIDPETVKKVKGTAAQLNDLKEILEHLGIGA